MSLRQNRGVMKQLHDKFIVTFPSTVAALEMESAAKQDGAPGRLIPVPSRISAGCGMCWCAEPDEEDAVRAVIASHNLAVEDCIHLD